MFEQVKNDIQPTARNITLWNEIVMGSAPTRNLLHQSKNTNKHRAFLKTRNVTERHTQGGLQPLGWWLFVTFLFLEGHPLRNHDEQLHPPLALVPATYPQWVDEEGGGLQLLKLKAMTAMATIRALLAVLCVVT
jgi:hypothetical protein